MDLANGIGENIAFHRQRGKRAFTVSSEGPVARPATSVTGMTIFRRKSKRKLFVTLQIVTTSLSRPFDLYNTAAHWARRSTYTGKVARSARITTSEYARQLDSVRSKWTIREPQLFENPKS